MRKEFLPYGRHDITERDMEAVVEILRSKWITTGPSITAFEKAIAEYTKAKFAVAVNSGTAALDITVGALGLTPGDEAITTPFTFAATSNALLYHGVKPVFADIDSQTWNLADGKKGVGRNKDGYCCQHDRHSFHVLASISIDPGMCMSRANASHWK